MVSVAFGIAAYRESDAQLGGCLDALRSAYPDSSVVVISDGGADYRAIAKSHRCHYFRGQRLKQVPCGALWWRRMFSCLHACSSAERAERLIKIDPDTFVRRALSFFPLFDVCGTLDNESDNLIQGGCQVFRRSAVETIVSSGVTSDPVYTRGAAAWNGSDSAQAYERDFGQISTDYVLSDIIRRLRLSYGSHPEIDSQWRRRRSFRVPAAIIHPVAINEG